MSEFSRICRSASARASAAPPNSIYVPVGRRADPFLSFRDKRIERPAAHVTGHDLHAPPAVMQYRVAPAFQRDRCELPQRNKISLLVLQRSPPSVSGSAERYRFKLTEWPSCVECGKGWWQSRCCGISRR
jgi:hypothetical protein